MTEAAAGSGYFNMVPDPDGSVRWLPMAIAYGPDIYAPLVLVTLRHYRGRPPLGITLGQAGVEEIRLGRQIIPVDRFGRFYINFLGPPGTFPTYSAAAVLAGRLPPGALKDKIVLVGATAVGIYDLRVTPFSGLSPGIEIQATALDNILRRQFLQVPRLRDFPVAAVVLLLGVILGLALPRWSAAWGFALAAVLGLGYLGFNYFLFLQGWQLELFYPLAEIAGVYTGVTVLRGNHPAPGAPAPGRRTSGADHPVLRHPGLHHPGRDHGAGGPGPGAARLSQPHERNHRQPRGDPGQVHGGCHHGPVRRASGHGGPRRQGLPHRPAGVGLNTGVVAVGNMGSDRLFDYTAVGDNVNLASRLEGLNKFYGTEILISESCARALGEGFILQEVDLVQVKGKKQPLAVFELLGEGPPEPALAEFLAAYHEGLELFRSRQWDRSAEALARAARLKPQNPHVQRYLRLTEDFRAHPPGPDWQGVTVMAEK